MYRCPPTWVQGNTFTRSAPDRQAEIRTGQKCGANVQTAPGTGDINDVPGSNNDVGHPARIKSAITSKARGTVIVISTIEIPPRESASTAKRVRLGRAPHRGNDADA